MDTITDNKGMVLERRAYKPFGEELEVYKDPDAGFTTNRGFTGHEHIEGTRLIHMNARLYDPMLGRFLSADPIIQDPYDTQSYNRYSYVRNNPLKYTDPSGHSWLSKIFKTLIQIIVAVVAYAILGPGGTFLNIHMGWLVGSGLNIAGGSAVILGAAMGATMGFAATLINGGSLSNAFGSMLKGALFGAVSAGIANEIGNWAGGLEGVGDGHSLSFFTEGSFAPALAKAAMHGIARGVIDTIQGGRFGAGFASGFVSSGFAVSQKWGTVESRTIVMAMVGGTTSQITGGKFANGAISGAFVHLFNAEMAHPKPELTKWDLDGNGKLSKMEGDSWYRNGKGQSIAVDASKLTVLDLENRDIVVAPHDYAAHGQVSLNSDGTIFSPAPYDFEMHKVRGWTDIFRNEATILGEIIADPFSIGQPYDIYYYNKPTAWKP